LEKELADQSRVIIITGNIQEGKTTYLIEMLALLEKKNIKVDGFIAKGIHDENGRIGYDLEHILDGESCVYIRNKFSKGWVRYGKYYFNPKGEEFGKRILESIYSAGIDLLVIDEIGPVELKGRGWAEQVERLVNTSSNTQLWVVRKPLLKKVIRQWNIGDILVLDVSTDTPKMSIDDVVSFIKNKD